MNEHEILRELERLRTELASIKTDASEAEKVQSMDASLESIRGMLIENRARNSALGNRLGLSHPEPDSGA